VREALRRRGSNCWRDKRGPKRDVPYLEEIRRTSPNKGGGEVLNSTSRTRAKGGFNLGERQLVPKEKDSLREKIGHDDGEEEKEPQKVTGGGNSPGIYRTVKG